MLWRKRANLPIGWACMSHNVWRVGVKEGMFDFDCRIIINPPVHRLRLSRLSLSLSGWIVCKHTHTEKGERERDRVGGADICTQLAAGTAITAEKHEPPLSLSLSPPRMTRASFWVRIFRCSVCVGSLGFRHIIFIHQSLSFTSVSYMVSNESDTLLM